MTRLITVREVAELLQVNRSTVWRWCQNGTLSSAFKIGRTWRIRWEEVEEIMKGQFNPSNGSRFLKE